MLDLYNVENPQQYLNPLESRIEEPDISEPFINMKGEKNNMLGLNEYDDGDLVNDDSDDDEEEVDESSSSLDRKSI